MESNVEDKFMSAEPENELMMSAEQENEVLTAEPENKIMSTEAKSEQTVRKRLLSRSENENVDPDLDYRDTLVSNDDGLANDKEAAEPTIQHLLQHFRCFDPAAIDFLSFPGKAIDIAEDFARYLWKTVPGMSIEKAEEIAKHAWQSGPGLAYDKAEEFAKHLWEAVPDLPQDRAKEIAHNIWGSLFVNVKAKTEDLLRQTWEAGKEVIHHRHLPNWLKDNDYLVKGHRPPLYSFWACFKSMFRIHTETGNIWTHLIGCIFFIGLGLYFLTRPSGEVVWEKKIVFSTFFTGAILCLSFSWLFHTCYCHSERVGRLFSKLDYCGIALLIVGSFVPWLYYCFYCHNSPRVVYLVCIIVLGILSIVVSMWDKFGQPQYRTFRAGVFVALGLSGVIPAAHYILWEGLYNAWNTAAMGYLFLMAFLYITGAFIYAARIPECIWPGKFDIWFQSHQIFHVFVVLAALTHYKGITEVAQNHTGMC